MDNFCTRMIREPYSDEKVKLIIADLLEQLKEIDKLDLEKKEYLSEYKSKKDERVVECQRLRRICEDGFDEKPVECRIELDFATNAKKYISIDSGDVVDEIAMSVEDRQGTLEFPSVEAASSDDTAEPDWPVEQEEENDGDKVAVNWPSDEVFAHDYYSMSQGEQAEKYGVTAAQMNHRIRKMKKLGIISSKRGKDEAIAT